MAPSGVAAELAAIAHRLWREHMAASSWRSGSVYDERAHTHDAMVPFEDLGRHDRRRLIRAVEYAGIADQLARLVDHQRGPDREFTIEEMRPGLPVATAGPPDQADERGAVEAWETDPEGELSLIRVRWADGEVSEHHPSARELRRV